MKTLLLTLTVLTLSITQGFAQVYTQGRLTVDVQNWLERDSLDCTGFLRYKYVCNLTNANAADIVKVYDFGWNLKEVHTNSNGSNPYYFFALFGVFSPEADYIVVNDTFYKTSSAHYVVCGADTVFVPGQTYALYWPNPCVYDTVEGYRFIDMNFNCQLSLPTKPVNLGLIVKDTVYNGKVKGAASHVGSNITGAYRIIMQKSFRTGCSISLPTGWNFIFPNSSCIVPSYSFYNLPSSTMHYPFAPSHYLDAAVYLCASGTIRPEVPFLLRPQVNNAGYAVANGQVYVVLPPHVSYNASLSSNPPAAISGDTLMWSFSNVTCITNGGYWNPNNTYLHVTPDSTLNIGDSLCFEIFTGPMPTDVNMANNYKTLCLAIVNSYDPNIKEVSPAGEGPTGIIPATTQELTYTVHFQNTGNAPALNITVLDTLDSNIDTSSFTLLYATHTLSPEWAGNGVFKARFANINLPDSTSNEPKSHGSFSFTVKLKPGLLPATQIKNSAAIYFDNNAPIITNTTVNTIETLIGVPEVSSANGISIYPNPANSHVQVALGSELVGGTLKLHNVTGAVVSEHKIESTLTTLNVNNLPKGFYLVAAEKQGVVAKTRFVVE